jgi:hypothetical protein
VIIGNARAILATILILPFFIFSDITPSESYPGKGSGLIGIVESINDPSFDPTDQTRDALFIGGSDDEGTVAAIEKAKSIIAEK